MKVINFFGMCVGVVFVLVVFSLSSPFITYHYLMKTVEWDIIRDRTMRDRIEESFDRGNFL